MRFNYSHEKNAKLLADRGLGFEEIIQAIANGNLLDNRLHHNQQQYSGQSILYVRVIDEIYAVPYVQEDRETIFLKTFFPTRKARKEFLSNKE
jgi:uncharacterized DUF497 family protein